MNNTTIKIFIVLLLFIVPRYIWGQEEVSLKPIYQINREICSGPLIDEIFPLSNLEGTMNLSVVDIDSDKKKSLFYYIRNYTKEQKNRYYYLDNIETNDLYYDSPCLSQYYTDQYRDLLFFGALTNRDTIIDNTFIRYTLPKGKWETYYKDPNDKRIKIKELNIDNQCIIGKYTVWNIHGDTIYQTKANQHARWLMKDFYPSGKIRVEGIYQKGLRDSIWTWYNEQEQVKIKELYRKGEFVKRLQPYEIKLNTSTMPSFIIVEDEQSKKIKRYFINSQDSVLWVRDTINLNLYFGKYSYAPKRVNISESKLYSDGRRKIDINLDKNTVYYDMAEMGNTTNSYYNLPTQINIPFNKQIYSCYSGGLGKIYSPMMKSIKGSGLKLKKPCKIYLYFTYSKKEKRIKKITGKSTEISSKKMDKIISSLEKEFFKINLNIEDCTSESQITYCLIVDI